MWQVLVSIQSAILGSQYPYFNEPGIESQWGTAQGRASCRTASNGGYERLRVATVQYAMVDQLQHPTPGFEGVIREHFRLKQHYILAQVEGWLGEARASPTPTAGHLEALEAQVKALREEFAKLPPPPPEAGGGGGDGAESGGSSGFFIYEPYPF